MKGLRDKVALVTGGSSGIGQAIAIRPGEEDGNAAINYAGRPEGAKTQRLARTQLNVTDARCEALFASGLQRSDTPDADMVAEAISHAVRQLGTHGCAGRTAQEFGDHPEMAADRMRWVRQLVGEVSAPAIASQASRAGSKKSRSAPGRDWRGRCTPPGWLHDNTAAC
jgi:NAD(P)-dependent dehydrogenase (short-subunit alcohol dehydrogenase family)